MLVQAINFNKVPIKENCMQEIAALHKQIDEIYRDQLVRVDLSNKQIRNICKKVLEKSQVTLTNIDRLTTEAAFNVRRDLKVAIEEDIKLNSMVNSMLQNCAITKLVEIRKSVNKLFPDLEAKIKAVLLQEIK